LIDGWERADIRKAMRAVLADEAASFEERAGALRSLAGREGEKPEIQRSMLAFYEQPSTRAAAMQAMAISEDPKFADVFRERLGDPDGQVCAQAILGVALLEMESEAPRLIPFFENDDLRNEALPSYAMCAPCEPSREGLRSLYKKIDDLAGGLSSEEELAVKDALNTRAERNGIEPVFGPDGEVLLDEPVVASAKTGRNDPCPCGSGKKYKKCCGG
jgi:HEAT repeat protein